MPTYARAALVAVALAVGAASTIAQDWRPPGGPSHLPDPSTPPGPFVTRSTAPDTLPMPTLPAMPPLVSPAAPLPTTAPPPPPVRFPTSFGSPPPMRSSHKPPTSTAPPPPTAAPSTPLPQTTDTSPAFDAYWNNGLFFRTKDKRFTTHIGGTLHYDGAWYTGGRGVQESPGGVGRFSDGVNLRRIRLLFEGTLHELFDYKLEVEVMNGFSPAGLTAPVSPTTVSNAPGPTDAYVTVKQVPWLGNVRIGNHKEWFSLEHLESHKLLLFMERSHLFDASQPSAFNNGRSPGISAFRTWANDSLFTAVGVYKNESNLLGYGVGDGEYAVTGRVAALPVWLPNAQTYWHVGGAMSHRDSVNDRVQVRVRNGVRNAPFPLLNLIADTDPIAADSQTLFNLESAFASGPLTVSGEFTTSLIDVQPTGGVSPGTLAYHGFYAQASYFLTGEHREWDPKLGVFKRVVPLTNFDARAGCWGGWEVGARVGHLDLDSRGVNGGRLSNVTLGLTWYWAANMRVQVNYDYLYRDGGPDPLVRGSIHSLGTRLALDF